MKKLVIFGNEKMAQLAHFYFKNDSDYEIVAFTVDQKYINTTEFMGLPVIPFEDVAIKYPPNEYSMFIAIGYKSLNKLRESKYFEAKGKGYKLASYFSSKSISWGDTVYGDNCFIFENQVFQPYVKIGNNVTIWSGNHFGHDVEINDHTFIASHVVLSGFVKVGSNCFIGINATIRDGVQIGSESIIGAGALINKDVKDKSVHIAQDTKRYQFNSEQFEKMMEISKR
jgi:sugar O-acyltransferase (sialic acid O-acetyltransferase NeuD family)